MAYRTRVDGNEYKFVRSGLFGTGTYVKIYLNGRLIDEMEFEDMGGDPSLLTESGYFETMCRFWAGTDNTNRRVEKSIKEIYTNGN